MDIVVFKSTMNDAVCDFLSKEFIDNRRKINFKTKDSDLLDIQLNYKKMENSGVHLIGKAI